MNKVSFTESYDIEIMKKLDGDMVAAVLYNKILAMHNAGTPRKDGFNWLEDKHTAAQIGVSQRTIVNAFKKLVDAGLVESKTVCKIGTRTPVRHFKPTLRKNCTDDYAKIAQTVNINNLINKNKEHYDSIPTPVSTQTEPPTADASVADATDDAFAIKGVKPSTPTFSAGSTQPREQGGVVKNTTLNSDPFSQPVEGEVDLSVKMRKKQAENAKVAILAQHLFDEFNGKTRHKASAAVRKAVRAKLFNEKFSERELVLAVRRAKKLDWYASLPVEVAIKDAGKLLNDKYYNREMDKKRYELGGLMY